MGALSHLFSLVARAIVNLSQQSKKILFQQSRKFLLKTGRLAG